jgi:hypothetical protein
MPAAVVPAVTPRITRTTRNHRASVPQPGPALSERPHPVARTKKKHLGIV